MSALDRISIAAIGVTAEELAEQSREAEAAGVECPPEQLFEYQRRIVEAFAPARA
jgi:hypothetical protein